MATAYRPASRIGSYFRQSSFALIFAAAGLGLGVWLASVVIAYFNMQGWEETPAKIVRADKANDVTNVEYQYRHQGQSYTGSRQSE